MDWIHLKYAVLTFTGEFDQRSKVWLVILLDNNTGLRCLILVWKEIRIRGVCSGKGISALPREHYPVSVPLRRY